MSYEAPFACITADTGLVAEILHVSPMFVRYGAPRRGRYAGRRLTRVRRTEERQARRFAATPVTQPEFEIVRSGRRS